VKRRTQFQLLVALTIVWALWAGWSLIGRATPYTLRVLDDTGLAVASAFVDVNGRQVATSGVDGLAEMEWSSSEGVLEVSAPGHVTRMISIEERPDGVVDVFLKARVLRGKVVDGDGVPVRSATVEAGPASGVTDEEGLFQIRGAEPGTVDVSRPAWQKTSFEWDGGPGEAVVSLEPFDARAVHITGDAVASQLDGFIDMAMTTELNALMIDLKDETGLLWYQSRDPTAVELGAIHGVYDLEEVAQRAHAAGLYLIGRLVVFQDPVAARARPSMAVWDTATNAPLTGNGQYFLDPTDSDSRAYALALAAEVCSLGVDEVQLDYVRFPDDRPESAQFDGGSVTPELRRATIASFLSEASGLLQPMGCALAADVFGYITAPSDDFPDGGVGQNWEEVSRLVDVVSPMVYPSHYDFGFYAGIENPNDQPGAMVGRALQDGLTRLTTNVIVRPWLQDFGYTEAEVREQIDVAESLGLGWMLWNAKSEVTVAALDPE
jgi:hypothetical protein